MNTYFTAKTIADRFAKAKNYTVVNYTDLNMGQFDRLRCHVDSNADNVSHFIVIKMSPVTFLITTFNANGEFIGNYGYDLYNATV